MMVQNLLVTATLAAGMSQSQGVATAAVLTSSSIGEMSSVLCTPQ